MIRVEHLYKLYGQTVAVKDLSFEAGAGDLVGLIGPNGAGKTTTIKILATLLRPTYGDAFIGEYSVVHARPLVKPMIGYVPDQFGVYENMRAQEYLQFFAAAYRIEGEEQLRTVDEVLELTDLSYKRDDLVLSLSRGMQQRLGLARALLHNPQVLLLDEPASGLDPRARVEIREVLKELQRLGKTILISSHILSELEEMCNKVVIMERGELIFGGAVAELRRHVHVRRTLEVGVLSGSAQAATLLQQEQPFVQAVAMSNGCLSLTLSADAPPVEHFSQLLIRHGFVLTRLRELEPSLEDVFMEVTRGLVS